MGRTRAMSAQALIRRAAGKGAGSRMPSARPTGLPGGIGAGIGRGRCGTGSNLLGVALDLDITLGLDFSSPGATTFSLEKVLSRALGSGVHGRSSSTASTESSGEGHAVWRERTDAVHRSSPMSGGPVRERRRHQESISVETKARTWVACVFEPYVVASAHHHRGS